jgi:hypothetical protein
MLLAVDTHCIDGQDDITNRQIERALSACFAVVASCFSFETPGRLHFMAVGGSGH